jgi:ribonucleoside-diphosphate reductase alpha chain
MSKSYIYSPTEYANAMLVNAKILEKNEKPQQMFERVVDTLYNIEYKFNTNPKKIQNYKKKFAYYFAKKAFTPGTPTLNNAGREKYKNAGLSSCAIIPVDLRQKRQSKEKIKAYYSQNMGSGFDLTEYENPVELLYWLNDLSATETATGKYDRYIGNMANIHVSHPKIREFISSKKNKYLAHFNLSIDIDDEFMSAVTKKNMYKLADDRIIDAYELLQSIAETCWSVGDPNIINLKKMNRDNPLEHKFPYTTTPPCSEMGMARGETCQFGYINLAFFAHPDGYDFKQLADATRTLTRTLDNAVELSLGKYPDNLSTQIAKSKRKIGIAISGIADLLLYYTMQYSSESARDFIHDILAFINYQSKIMSIELAEERGPCEAMAEKNQNKYYDGFLSKRFCVETTHVKKIDWVKLDEKIMNTGLLRNISTTAIPPAARVSILMDCSSGIEPFFGIPQDEKVLPRSIVRFVKKYANGKENKIIRQACKEGTFQNLDLINKECLKTAKEISYKDHLLMTGRLVGDGGMCDETASKTVNLPNDSTPDDIRSVFLEAHTLGLKNIAVYRDGSIKQQPKKL